MSEFDYTQLVYSSSATVYGTPPVVPFPETTRLKTDTPYGQSKVMCENIIQDLTQGALLLLYHKPPCPLMQAPDDNSGT